MERKNVMRKITTLLIVVFLQIIVFVTLSISAKQPKNKNRPKMTSKKESPGVSATPQSVSTAS